MQAFKIGDRVIHKLCGLKMTIIRLSDDVATCKRDEPWFWKYDNDPHYTAICNLTNLELIKQQQI